MVNERRKAYHFMVNFAGNTSLSPSIDSDAQLATALDVPLKELVDLKDGTANPSARLVAGFKKLACPYISEEKVDDFLVKPFRKRE